MVESDCFVKVYRGSREICDAVGINYKEIVYYREHHGLPAFKICNSDGRQTQWLALPEDLNAWIRKQRDMHIKK